MRKPIPADALRIPGTLNVTLAMVIAAGFVGLQLGAAHARGGWALFGFGVAFGLLGLPLYTLMHETFHRCFHEDEQVNDVAGVLLSALFPGPFTFMRATHAGHHGRNRTDVELFDGYYPGDSVLKKRALFYFLYLGGFWLLLPITIVLMLVYPRAMLSTIIQDVPASAAMVNGVPTHHIARIRLECLGIVVLHTLILWATGWSFTSYLVLYALFAFSWSSQNYITHAWTPRRVLDGAHNMRVHPLFGALLLNFNWHLAHHQHPSVPWLHLPKVLDPEREQPSMLRLWIRQWQGPQLVTEPCPTKATSADAQHTPTTPSAA